MNDILNRVLEELRNAWRYRWRGLFLAWLLAIVGWLFVYSMPDQYEVEARVHIDTQSAIAPLLGNMAVTPNFDQQVRFLIQTVLSRPNLRDIARRTGLDIKATTPEAEEALLDNLEQRIQIWSTGGRNINLYNVSFASSSAETARSVVQQVIEIMTRMALGDKGDESTSAIGFVKREVDRYKSELDSLERKLGLFRQDNTDLLPGKGGYFARLQSLQADVVNLGDRLSAAENKRELLRSQVSSGGSGGSRVVPPEQSQQVREIDSRIAQRRGQLEQMLAQYTEQYPDVGSLRREIARLEASRADKIAELRVNPERTSTGSSPGYSEARQDLNATEVEIHTLQAALKRKKGQITDMQANAGEMTEAQAKLGKLQRDYNVTKEQYDKLLSRLYRARLSEDAESGGNRMKFSVIDPPELPTEPSGPQRPLLMTVVLFGALVGGAAFAFFMSQIRPVFITRRALTDATGLPVLGAVTMALGLGRSSQRRFAVMMFAVGVASLVLFYVAALALAPVGAELVPNFLSSRWL